MMDPKEVFTIFHNLNSKQDVQNLFTELNFEPTTSLQSEINLVQDFISSKLKDNIDSINLINEVDNFFIFFCKLKLPDLNKGRIIQREISRKISKKTDCIIVFSNNSENIFKITYVSVKSEDNIKLSSYTIAKSEKLRTASEQIAKLEIGNNYSKADIIKHISSNKIFDIEPVTEEFFAIIKKYVDKLSENFYKYFNDLQQSKAFALQFFNRILFLKYIEKKKWLNNNPNFLEELLKRYKSYISENPNLNSSIYIDIFQPLFFYAFSKHKEYMPKNLSPKLIIEFEKLPYLNGGLFEKSELDINEAAISDEFINEIFSEIINRYNFTITEDTPFDREIAIDPEMLGLIYEGIVNSDERSGSGIFYTPRIEVDFMCKKSLLHFLSSETKVDLKKLINLIFSEHYLEEESENYSETLTLSEKELISRALNNMKVVDPACGSGAFLIGILQNIINIFIKLENINIFESEIHFFEQIFKLKKDLIEKVIHGVDIKPWAVQIAELRLWLYLIGDYEGSITNFGYNPILPSLDFKIRHGDSLLSEIEGYQIILRDTNSANKTNPKILKDIKELKDLKLRYYYHDDSNITKQDIEEKEREIIKSILILKKRDLIREFELLYNAEKVADPSQLFESSTKEKADLYKFRLERELNEKNLNLEIERIDNIINKISELKGKGFFIWDLDFADVFFEVQKGGFDIVIGNPPYIRQEEIAPPLIEKDKISVEIKSHYKEKLINNVINIYGKEKISKFDKKSDYYVYFYFISLSLLKEKGIFTFINSTSWLDVGYGVFLQEFLLKNFRIIDIHDNSAKRSFKSADINTIIISIGKPEKNYDVLLNKVKFINHKTAFENSITLKNILEIYLKNDLINNEYYRMIVKSQKDLLEEGIENDENEIDYKDNIGKYTGSKWGGKYLRAPDIYYKILEKGKGKLIPLKEVAEVRFGIKTGANEFFYVEPTGKPAPKGLLHVRNGAGWEGFIEEEFLKPVIKSPRECKSIIINPKDLKYKVFLCNKSKQELKDTYTLKYIEWGERQNFHKRPTCSNRHNWSSLKVSENSDFFCMMSFNDRHIFWQNKNNLVDARLYDIYLYNQKDYDILTVILNSSITPIFIELGARTNLGEGALDFKVYEAERIFVLNPEFLNNKILEKINKGFLSRKILSIFEECGFNPKIPIRSQEPNPLPDRKALDDIIFDILGLTEEERKEVYWAVCELVQNRLNKAGSV
ncbi:MAG: Eco57I restriction-modification methylase domain-containing protein [Actinobacteria bacterium]|nr:Eco57I restriction-modification methylase domain-containing protein [Cyanobacteriota bacterium]MCL5771656.1 Eco57I restriction-modification methylase domain-containing protein [Actinomycetota bacterium]